MSYSMLVGLILIFAVCVGLFIVALFMRR